MASDNEIDIPINFETANAQKQLSNFQKTTTTSVSQIALAFTGINQALELAGKAFNFVSAPLLKAIEEASQAEKQFAKLNFAMAATGEFSREAADGMAEFAGEIQKTTTFSDDAAVEALTLAKNFGLTNEAAQRLVTTATNLAAATGRSLPEAANDLLASLRGQTKGLRDLGNEFTNLTEEQARAGRALEILDGRLTDVAQNLTRTFSGAVAQAGNNFDDLFETFGKVVIENDAVIESVKLFSEVFISLADLVKNNSGTISSSISTALSLVIDAFSEVINIFTIVSQAFLTTVDFTARGATVVGSAFSLLSGNLEDAKAQFQAAFSDTSDVNDSFTELSDSLFAANERASETSERFKDVSNNAGKTETALNKISAGAKKTGASFGKLQEEARKFADDMIKSSADELTKVQIDRDAEIAKIRKFIKDKSLSEKEGNELIAQSRANATKKILDIQEKEQQQSYESLQKSIAERRKLVEDASKDPANAFVQKLQIEAADISENASQIAGFTAGVISTILDGAAGAKSLIASGAGAFADAFIPGIGGAVTSIVSKLAEGPDATKAFIKEFIASVPDIVNAIAESIPVVVETFVDVMVNKGGAARIGVAIAKAMSGQTIFKKAGLNIAEGFNAKLNGGKFYDGLKAAIAGIGPALTAGVGLAAQKFSSTLGASVANLASGIGAGILSVISQIGTIFAPIAGNITAAFQPVITFFTGLPNLFTNVVSSLTKGIPTPPWLNQLTSAFNKPSWLSSLTSAFDKPSWISTFIKDLTKAPGWVNKIRDAFDDLIDALENLSFGGFGGGSGGDGYVPDNIPVIGGLATGGTVPAGFPNDTFPTKLTSGEMVVPTDTTTKLKQFLDGNAAPKSSSQSDELQIALLTKIATLLQQPMTVETTAQVNGKAFADIILGLNRSNARLTA
jgi:hypothetical protein